MIGDELFIRNEALDMVCRGTPDNNDKRQRKLAFRLQPDGTLRAWSPVILLDPNGREIIAAGEITGQQEMSLYATDTGGNITAVENETTGELRVVGMGWDGAAPIRNLNEATGEPIVSLRGQDEAGNLDALRTDPNRNLWRRDYPAYVSPLTAPSVEIPVAEGILWNPGGANTVLYEVYFNIVNNDAGAAAVTVSVGLDIGGGGGLAAPEYWIYNEVIGYPGETGWRGPYLMTGDDDIRGIASVANDASIHFRIRRVDQGG